MLKKFNKKILFLVILGLAIGFLYSINSKVDALDDEENLIEVNDDEQLTLVSDAKSAYLLEPTTLKVIYQKNPLDKRPPASMTKIMTMILIMEALEKKVFTLDDYLTASEHASSMGGTNIYLEPGEKMKVIDLLKSLAIASANDSAMVFAETIGGSEDNFVKMMNNKAKQIGATNTVFKNPHGLPETGHYSCARDMALMGAYLVNNYPEILKYTSIYEDYVRENTEDRFWLVNTNKLVKFVEGVDGIKTGWTDEAGYCLTASIKRNGMRYIAVAMGCSTTKSRNAEIMQMLNYALNTYEVYPIYSKNSIIETYEDVRFYPKTYHIIITQDVNVLRRKGDQLKEVKVEKNINYGDIGYDNKKVGTIKIFYGGELLKEVNLAVEEEIKKASFFTIFLEVLKEIFLVSSIK